MGCRVCRARKVKCDGRPNGCRNCERLQLECLDDDGAKTGRRSVAIELRKIRTYRSCTGCRVSKTKCDGHRPKCSRCRGRELECQYDGGSSPRWARNLSRAPTTASVEEPQSPALMDGSAIATPSLVASREVEDDQESLTPPISREESTPQTAQLKRPVDPVDDPRLSLYRWLLSPELPTNHHMRQVIDQYFINIHPLRCFAFVHRPSFMQQLDKGFQTCDEKALLFIICAHGAKFYALNIEHEDPDAKATLIRAAGNKWAQKAESLVLLNLGKLSIQKLMTSILLCDFHVRLGEYVQALMVSGLTLRMAHALQLNVEHSTDILCADGHENALPAVEKESRRRLMWAGYILDAWTGNGIDQLTLLKESDIKIQLPCNERNFRLRIPCVTETLGTGHVLQFLPPAIVPRTPAANMGIMAYYIRVVTLWKRVVRYVKHIDTSPPPWLPDSDFAALDADLRSWQKHVPEFVSYSADTIYARVESDQLGCLVLINCTYHHNLLDLYRISMPQLFKLKKPFHFPPAQSSFLESLHNDCFYHAHQISGILAEASRHGARHLADSLLPCFTYDSSRVMLYYIACLLDKSRPDAKDIIARALEAVENNNRMLRIMSALFPLAESLCTTTERWMQKIRKGLGQEDSDMEDALPDANLDSRRSIVSASHRQSIAEQTNDSRPNGSVRETSLSAFSDNSPSLNWSGVGGSRPKTPVRPGLQHEQPVSAHLAPMVAPPPQPMANDVDLTDLQRYLSWDMYGIMEMNESGLKAGIEGASMTTWPGLA